MGHTRWKRASAPQSRWREPVAREADSLRGLRPPRRADAAPSCQSVVGGGKKQATYRKKHRYRCGPKGPGILSRSPRAVGGNQGKQGSDRQVRPHSPTSQTIQTGAPAPSTATPTPTSWKTDDCHRTFRPMRKRHHSPKSSLSWKGYTSASGAPAAFSPYFYWKGLLREVSLLRLAFWHSVFLSLNLCDSEVAR